jgi:hypothetical protein
VVAAIKLENNTYIMTTTVTPICCGFMFPSDLLLLLLLLLLCFFGLCVVKLEDHTYILCDRWNNLLWFYVSEWFC